jgi:hypothetical protein
MWGLSMSLSILLDKANYLGGRKITYGIRKLNQGKLIGDG